VALANENYIKRTMYESNNMEEMSIKLRVVQCTVPKEAAVLN
jgi:hypothetical protein